MTRRVARTALDQVRTAVWQLYRDLKSYQAEPTAQAQQMLEDRFDALYATRTCFTSLNLALKRMHRNKAELLLILERPVLALHNNLNEGDIREYVKRRKAACPPADDRRTEDGSGRSASSAPILPRFPSGRRSAYRRIPRRI